MGPSLLYLALTLLHPIYITTYHLQIANDGNWKGTIRMFYDDLEDALHNQQGKRPTLSEDQLNRYQASIAKYLFHHFQITDVQTANEIHYHISELEREQDVIVIQINGDNPWTGQVKIFSSTLLELFESQKNIFELSFPQGKSRYSYLHRSLQEETIQWPIE